MGFHLFPPHRSHPINTPEPHLTPLWCRWMLSNEDTICKVISVLDLVTIPKPSHTCCWDPTSSTPLLSPFQPLEILYHHGRLFNTLQPHEDPASDINRVTSTEWWWKLEHGIFDSTLISLYSNLPTLYLFISWAGSPTTHQGGLLIRRVGSSLKRLSDLARKDKRMG